MKVTILRSKTYLLGSTSLERHNMETNEKGNKKKKNWRINKSPGMFYSKIY